MRLTPIRTSPRGSSPPNGPRISAYAWLSAKRRPDISALARRFQGRVASISAKASATRAMLGGPARAAARASAKRSHAGKRLARTSADSGATCRKASKLRSASALALPGKDSRAAMASRMASMSRCKPGERWRVIFAPWLRNVLKAYFPCYPGSGGWTSLRGRLTRTDGPRAPAPPRTSGGMARVS